VTDGPVGAPLWAADGFGGIFCDRGSLCLFDQFSFGFQDDHENNFKHNYKQRRLVLFEQYGVMGRNQPAEHGK
jgi:hypothetical protein